MGEHSDEHHVKPNIVSGIFVNETVLESLETPSEQIEEFGISSFIYRRPGDLLQSML